MIEFKCGEAATFEFEMLITGDLQGSLQTCFNINAGDMTLSFPAVEKSSGVYEVKVPVLDKFLAPGSYSCNISVVIGDHYYVPASDTCELKLAPKPTVSGISVKPSGSQAPAFKVTMGAPTPPPIQTAPSAPPPPTPEPIRTESTLEPKKPEPKPEPKKRTEAHAMFDELIKRKK